MRDGKFTWKALDSEGLSSVMYGSRCCGRVMRYCPIWVMYSCGEKLKSGISCWVESLPAEEESQTSSFWMLSSSSWGNKNRLCSKTCGGYEILVTKDKSHWEKLF